MDKLNILVIMSDQHNKKITGCYGDNLVRTPNIDKLAAEGMLFESCYCPSSVCVPSRMSFISGRRPSENRVVNNYDILSSGIMTWPERLREGGYHTALIGRMHFEGPDQFHGFETTYEELRHWRGNRPVENQHMSERVPGNSYWSARKSIEDLSGSGRTFVQYRDEIVCQRGCEFLRSKVNSIESRPFAAVIGLYNPHPPYVGRKDLFDYYYERVSVPTDTLDLMPDYLSDYYSKYRDWENPTLIDEESKRRARAAYYANCEHLDEQVGKIVNTLEETGLKKNTLVFYCSDHGDTLGRLGAWSKFNMYDDSAGIPMIACLPGVVPAGTVSRRNCNLRDLGNTFCEIAGVDFLNGSDSTSLWNILRGIEEPALDRTESEIVLKPSPFGAEEHVAARMIMEGPWKLWCYHIDSKNYYSLFNLEEDPDELNDRIDDPALSDIITSMKNILHENWDPEREEEDAAIRYMDRQELNKSWYSSWQKAGYPVLDDLDKDVDTPHTRKI
ncbi:MAG: sulfatase-like hydrolase/transferase [Halanaerobiales bacterium]